MKKSLLILLLLFLPQKSQASSFFEEAGKALKTFLTAKASTEDENCFLESLEGMAFEEGMEALRPLLSKIIGNLVISSITEDNTENQEISGVFTKATFKRGVEALRPVLNSIIGDFVISTVTQNFNSEEESEELTKNIIVETLKEAINTGEKNLAKKILEEDSLRTLKIFTKEFVESLEQSFYQKIRDSMPSDFLQTAGLGFNIMAGVITLYSISHQIQSEWNKKSSQGKLESNNEKEKE